MEAARSAASTSRSMEPREYATFVAAERIKWGKVIRDAKISLD